MTILNRRGFVKSLLTAAAGATSAHSVLGRGGFPTKSHTREPAASVILENGEQQLHFSPAGVPLIFQNYLRTGNEWKPSTLPGISIVTGPSFSLMTSVVRHEASAAHYEGNGAAKGLGGQPLQYSWKAEIEALTEKSAAPWFRFRLALDVPAAIRLQQGTNVEPQIIIWLNSVSTLMEGQSGNWRRVTLSQPTRNSLGASGNDLPALYLLDQTAGVETMMYFDMSDMGWMSIDNLPRFLVYRCSTVSQIGRDGTQRLGAGLIADQATGDALPAGEARFTYYLLQRPLRRLLTEQEAVRSWMSALLPLFEQELAWPNCASTWKDYAEGTVKDLQQRDATRVEVNGHAGLRAYVKDSSRIWQPPADNFELMTIADVLWPSLLYLKLHPSAAHEGLCKELLADLPGFYHADSRSISNDFVRPVNERADSWYPFENSLIKYPIIGSLAGSKEVTERFLEAFQTAEKFAHQYDYLFPIYYQVATLQAEGAGTNYAIGGLYAWSAILAHRLTGDDRYREEARRAIQALCHVPSDRLFHEPQELAYGALAAAELGQKEASTYLLFEQLRMFYWYSDPSQKSHDVRGMVQAAASILYPAFKENVEAILPWTGVLKRGVVMEGLLRFLDQQRRNNFYFFQKCSGNSASSSMAYIPFENLGTLELGGQTGNVGKEIYGAGECLWMYLMFEALGHVADRELMLVNLDLLDTLDANLFPSTKMNFLLYNPTPDKRQAVISIPPAGGRAVRLSREGKTVSEAFQVPAHGIIQLLAEY